MNFISHYSDTSLHQVSYDVVSLFTNIPLKESIECIIEQLFTNSHNTQLFNASELRKLLTVANEGIFSFQDRLYRQIDGVSMGNPLAPLLAEAFMANFEEKMFSSDASQQKPIKYCRYVDDTFALFKNENDSLKFLSVLNSQHPAIRFTIEPQKEHKLPFLDVEIIFDGNTITTRPYRKPTFTGKLLNFKWIVPKSWKVGLIKNMIHRIWLTSSTWKVFCEEVETLTDILTFNEYPKWLIFRNIRKIVTDYYHNTGRDNQKDKEDISHVIKLQYLGKASDRLKTSLLKIFKKYQINNTACIFNTKQSFSKIYLVKNYF